jgi:hypothetical protein
VLNHLPHVIFEVEFLELLSHIVDKVLITFNTEDLDVNLCSDYEIDPFKVQYKHLSLNLIVIIVFIVHNKLTTFPPQVEITVIDSLVYSHILLGVRAFDLDCSDQFALLVKDESVGRGSQPRLSCSDC